MTATRRSFFTPYDGTPRGQLDELWRKTMQLMSTAIPAKSLDEQKANLHEAVGELRQWADRQHATTGIYPDGEVQKFLAKFSRTSEPIWVIGSSPTMESSGMVVTLTVRLQA